MTHHDDGTDELTDLTNRELLRVLMQEIVDTRNELKQEFKQDIADVDKKLIGIGGRVDVLEKKIDKVTSELHTLRIEVHHNQSTFIANQTALEKRVKVLEMAA